MASFADADGCVDLSDGDHVDIKRDGTSIGLRADPIGSIEEFLWRAFVVVCGPQVSLEPGQVAEVWGSGLPPTRSPWRASGLE